MDASPAQIVEIVSHLKETKYATVASASVLIWDMAITFDLEVAMVWRAKKTLGTTLFFLNRYLTPAAFVLELYSVFAPNPSVEFCNQYNVWAFIIAQISTAIVLWVLILRIHALYQNHALKLFLACLSIIAIANMVTSLMVIFHLVTSIPASSIGTTGCVGWCTKPVCRTLSITFWIPYILVETIIVALTAWKSYKSLNTSRLSGTTTGATMKVLMRDGLVYYFVILSMSLCVFLVWILVPWAPDIVTGLFKALQATMCSRILLNLRGVLDKRSQPELESLSQPRWQSIQLTSGSYGSARTD